MVKDKGYLDALLSLPLLNTVKVSYDKAWIVWSWSNIGPAEQVYLTLLDSQDKIHKIPSPSSENNWVVSASPDSKSFIIGQDQGGDERVQLFLIKIANLKERIPLTESSPDYFLRGGSLHPKNQLLFYGANYDFEKEKEIEPTLVYRHDLKTQEKRVLARPLEPIYTEPELNFQGTHILYSRGDLDPSGGQIWMVDVEGKEDREILNFGSKDKVFASWLPDGERVIFLAEKKKHRAVGLLVLKNNKVIWLIDDPTRNIEAAFVPHNSEYAVIIEEKEARTKASLLSLKTFKETPVSPSRGDLTPISPLKDGRWLGIYSNSQNPTDIVEFSLKKTSPEKFISITRLWEHFPLKSSDLVEAETFKWRSVGRLEIQGWLYKAKKHVKGTIVLIHGGPTSHSRDRFNPQIQYLVARGFNVLEPNYRGSTGFGLEFQELIKKTYWGGLEQEDIRTGIETLIKEGIAHKGKVGITGTSYGGYCAWFAITHFSKDIVAAAAPICGMTDLIVDYETTRPDLRPYSEEMLGGSPKEVPDRYKKRSPINFLQNIKGELLIVQGLRDPNVTPQNVHEVELKLKEAGILYEKLVFKDEGHGISKLDNKKILYKHLADFFEQAFNK